MQAPDSSVTLDPTIQSNPLLRQQIPTAPEPSKTPLVVGSVLCVIALISLIIGVVIGAQIEKIWIETEIEKDMIDIGNEYNITYDDDDGLGELGWFIYVPMSDAKASGFCDTFALNVTINGEVQNNSVTTVCEDEAWKPMEDDLQGIFELEGYALVGRVCSTLGDEKQLGVGHNCSENMEYTISLETGDYKMKFLDSDPLMGEIMLSTFGLSLASGGAWTVGCCSLCIGGIFFVFGLIQVMKKPQQEIIYMTQ